ncbi:hypothetical protein NKG05_15845 [Oerskovia sp. M15]
MERATELALAWEVEPTLDEAAADPAETATPSRGRDVPQVRYFAGAAEAAGIEAESLPGPRSASSTPR